ncbi:MAG: hypothetical protein PHP17_02180 [Candidatus Omnitrophica bacterium]|nr:hypothetical protein [Candidatus Omnitrophota bacterium]
MKNKFLCNFLIFSFLFALPLCAQKINEAYDIVLKMEKVLHLTPQETASIEPIVREYTAKRRQYIKDFMDKGTIDKSLLRAKLKELREKENKKLGAILTPEQIKKWSDHQNLTKLINGSDQDEAYGSFYNFDQSGMSF